MSVSTISHPVEWKYFCVVDFEEEMRTEKETKIYRKNQKKMKNQVLIISNKLADISGACDFFETKGIDVRRSATAETALYLVTVIQPPLILIDNSLKAMNPLTFAQIIKGDQRTKDILLVMMTEQEKEKLADHSFLSIWDGIIKYPIDNESFYATVQSYLNTELN